MPISAQRRETSAKAFGTLANALPEEMLGDLADASGMAASIAAKSWVGMYYLYLQVYSYSTEPIF